MDGLKMSAIKVRALYDFNSEYDNEMRHVFVGDVLTILDKNVGDGWWKCCNLRTQEKGLVPISYLEEMPPDDVFSEPPPKYSPPQLPSTAYNSDDASDDSWGDFSNDEAGSNHYSEIGHKDGPNHNSDRIYCNLGSLAVSTDSNSRPNLFKKPLPPQSQITRSMSLTTDAISGPRAAVSRPILNKQASGDNAAAAAALKNKNLNRLSTFHKSSLDDYLLGVNDINVSSASKITVLSDHTWARSRAPYTVSVNLLKKEGKKLKGLKKFTLYELLPSFSQTPVERRYKHFDWLHERLSIKYGLIAVPPIPEKKLHNIYKDEFIEYRCVQFQKFVDWICSHPILSDSDVWMHFITCPDSDEKRWKNGKRQAERDCLIGPKFCLTITAPSKTLLSNTCEPEIDSFISYINLMDSALKNLQNMAQNQKKYHQGPSKREFLRTGESFTAFSKALEADQDVTSSGGVQSNRNERHLAQSLQSIATAYVAIGKMYDEQQKIDWEPFCDNVTFLRGIVSCFPDVLNVYKIAQDKRKECEKKSSENKMERKQLLEAQRRVDIITYAIISEINHFRSQRHNFIMSTMSSFLEQQIHFYTNMVQQLRDALSHLNTI